MDTESRATRVEAYLSIPCEPVPDDGFRCWRRVGRSHRVMTIPGGDSGVVQILLSRAGRMWLRRHPKRRPQLALTAYSADAPDHPVELRLRVHVPRA